RTSTGWRSSRSRDVAPVPYTRTWTDGRSPGILVVTSLILMTGHMRELSEAPMRPHPAAAHRSRVLLLVVSFLVALIAAPGAHAQTRVYSPAFTVDGAVDAPPSSRHCPGKRSASSSCPTRARAARLSRAAPRGPADRGQADVRRHQAERQS